MNEIQIYKSSAVQKTNNVIQHQPLATWKVVDSKKVIPWSKIVKMLGFQVLIFVIAVPMFLLRGFDLGWAAVTSSVISATGSSYMWISLYCEYYGKPYFRYRDNYELQKTS